jgi:hypothetical protein
LGPAVVGEHWVDWFANCCVAIGPAKGFATGFGGAGGKNVGPVEVDDWLDVEVIDDWAAAGWAPIAIAAVAATSEIAARARFVLERIVVSRMNRPSPEFVSLTCS